MRVEVIGVSAEDVGVVEMKSAETVLFNGSDFGFGER